MHSILLTSSSILPVSLIPLSITFFSPHFLSIFLSAQSPLSLFFPPPFIIAFVYLFLHPNHTLSSLFTPSRFRSSHRRRRVAYRECRWRSPTGPSWTVPAPRICLILAAQPSTTRLPKVMCLWWGFWYSVALMLTSTADFLEIEVRERERSGGVYIYF